MKTTNVILRAAVPPFAVLLFVLTPACGFATVRYVDAASVNPTPPHTNWATAARVIQDAVDAALAGDEIIVTNGVYATGGRTVGTNLLVNRLAADKALSLRSVNGPDVTIIQGHQVPGTTNGDGAVRCFYLADGASLSGFTLTNGGTRAGDWAGDWERERSGGGGWCESTSAVVANCVISCNSADWGGGGVKGGTLNNCVLSGNSAYLGGGAFESKLNNCIIKANSSEGGGGIFESVANNCAVITNSALWGGGAVNCTMNNCTIIGNSAQYDGGVVADFGWTMMRLTNCVVYYNIATITGGNYSPVSELYYCCTSPMPTSGVGNFTNAPLFVDAAADNYRLRPDSPCINAGCNADAPGLTDLDGRPRIVGGTVDIGAWEFQPVPGAWTQKADLPAPTSTATCAVLDGILYVIGGLDNKDATHALTNVWAYDPKTDTWSERAPLPTARHFAAQYAPAVDGLIYVVGGSGQGRPGPLIPEIAIYNPKTDAWTNGAPIPTPRGPLAACELDGIIYTIGGSTGYDLLAAVEAYDPKNNRWTIKRPLPEARFFLTASVVNDLIYVFHGRDLFIYNPQTDTWTSKKNSFAPYSWGLRSAVVDGIIYLFGGFTEDWTSANDFTLAYDPVQDVFSPRRRMPRKRSAMACGVIAGKVYLAGGVSKEPVVNDDPEFYRAVDIFDPQGGVMPQVLSLTHENSNRVRLVWRGEVGQRYGVEFRPKVADGLWTRSTFSSGFNAVVATNASVGATCIVPNATSGFFRVIEP